MAIDWGIPIAVVVVAYIIAIGYKKKTGDPISKLWKDKGFGKKAKELVEGEGYKRVYINRGIKT